MKFKELREGLSKRLHNREKELNLKLKELKIRAAIRAEREANKVQEGTWAVPDSYEKLMKLQGILKQKNIANTVKQVEKFQNQVYNLFGDDSFFDFLDITKDLIKGKDVSDYIKTLALKHKLGKGMDLNLLLQRELTRWTNGAMTFKGNKINTVPGDWMDKESQDEAMKRGRGNLKFKKSQVVRFEDTEEE